MKWLGVTVGFAGIGVVVACSADPDPVRVSATALTRATSCADLLSRIHADAISKLDMMTASTAEGRPGRGIPTGSAGVGGAGGGGGSGGSSSPPTDSGSRPPDGYTDTNTQVAGVDEADIVKTDGEHIYVLHGTSLVVLDSWPAEQTSLRTSVDIEGQPVEMFVRDGRAAVFSHVYGDATRFPGSQPSNPSYDCGVYGCGYGWAFTKITLIDTTGAAPSVLRELFVEGNYVSSRRHDSQVRAVIQGGFKAPTLYFPNVTTHDAWGNPYPAEIIEAQLAEWRARTAADIRRTQLSDWLPRRFEVQNGVLVEVDPQCTSYYVPEPGVAGYGLTDVLSFDLTNPAALPSEAIVLGSASQVYANADVLLLAHPDYRWSVGRLQGDQTSLHLFNLEQAGSTTYAASGAVPGTILNQFSINERDGVVAVSTTRQSQVNPATDRWNFTTTNQVVTLSLENGKLAELGSSGPLAPGERVFSTRFVGDLAFVVTFRQTDPLFAIDLSDPSQPTLLGELHIPGFSDYMHPLGDNHLLTIGRDATDQGRVLGLMLQIFDVSDPTHPTLAHKYVYTTEGYSEANANHKAFMFDQARSVLAFPFVGYYPNFTSSLELFRIDAASGFTKLGSIDHTGLFSSRACFDPSLAAFTCSYAPEVRRGLMIEDYVYSISHAGVRVHPLSDLGTAAAEVILPEPRMSQPSGAGGLGTGGTGGDVPPDIGGAGGAAGSG